MDKHVYQRKYLRNYRRNNPEREGERQKIYNEYEKLRKHINRFNEKYGTNVLRHVVD